MLKKAKAELHAIRDLPVTMKIVSVAAIGLFLTSAALIASMPFTLDRGMATLLGAVIGLGIIAYQTKVGFTNLIASQANQSTLDREAREHQAVLDAEAQERTEARQKQALLASLRAEVINLVRGAEYAHALAKKMRDSSRQYANSNPTWTVDRAVLTSFDAPIYRANIQHLGLLGASLAADIITVMSPADGKPADVHLSAPVSYDQIVNIYENYVLTKWQWIRTCTM